MSAQGIDPRSRIAGRIVLTWVRVYTRNVSPAAAQQRRAELASDVWEQVNDAEVIGLAAGPFLLWRAARSVPSDLAWRRAARSGHGSKGAPLHIRWERSGLLGVMLLESLVVGGLLLGTIVHILHGGGAGALGRSAPAVLAALSAGVLLTVVAAVLLCRARTRPLAPAALGVAAVVLLLTGLPALEWISTTVSAIYNTSPLLWTHPGWSEMGALVLGLVVVFHAAVTVAWLPSRARGTGGTR